MQVSLTATGGLERRLEVAIPASQIDGEVAQRLNKISRTARLKGFRPGKAPLAVIRQQYGDQVHGEVINDLMRASFSEAVQREKLNPAGGPRIEPIAMAPGSDLKYAAVFEVLPEVRIAPLSELTIERHAASTSSVVIATTMPTARSSVRSAFPLRACRSASAVIARRAVGRTASATFMSRYTPSISVSLMIVVSASPTVGIVSP